MKSILLIGLGLFGRQIAETLHELGHEVLAVDNREEAVNEVLPAIHELVADNLWILIPLQNVQQSVIANAKLHNIPVGGVGIAGNFVAELFFYGE